MGPKPSVVLPATAAVLATVLVIAIAVTGSSKHTTSNDRFDGATYPPGVRAPDFTLTDQSGHVVSLSSYRGQVVALAFLSPDCRTCVLVAQQVRGALDELGASPSVRTIFVSSRTAAPRARVGRLLRETSLAGRVEYLTGTPKELRPVWHAYGAPPPSAGKAASEAAVTVLLIDRSGIERIGFGLEQLTPEGLSHDIRLLLAA